MPAPVYPPTTMLIANLEQTHRALLASDLPHNADVVRNAITELKKMNDRIYELESRVIEQLRAELFAEQILVAS